MLFQQTIHTNRYNRSKLEIICVDDAQSNKKPPYSNGKLSLEEVPSIQNLKEQVENLIIHEENDFETSTFMAWNFRFHQMI